MTLLPLGPELLPANRRLLAERLDWPAGAVDECERLDAEFPTWHVFYRHAAEEEPGGWYAHHEQVGCRGARRYGTTADELREKIREHRCQF